jgi:hypothetical protein
MVIIGPDCVNEMKFDFTKVQQRPGVVCVSSLCSSCGLAKHLEKYSVPKTKGPHVDLLHLLSQPFLYNRERARCHAWPTGTMAPRPCCEQGTHKSSKEKQDHPWGAFLASCRRTNAPAEEERESAGCGTSHV